MSWKHPARRKAANDSICRAKRAEKAASAKNMRAEYLKNVKAILTPEQYVQFLENNYVNAPQHHKKGKFGKDGRKHKRHDNKNFGNNRPNRGK